MKPRTIANIAVLIIVLAFLIANWRVITMSTELNLLFARLQAPLGVLILIVGAAIFAVEFIVHALSRRTWSRERLGLARELEALRLRADEVEGARIKELRDQIERETAVIRAQLERLLASTPTAQRGPQR
ncbi:MAG TPA: hypothetical protein VMG11_11575 [Steroidobacteraceae bacterium]|nr:hypothetical protein [Steroidobacteraceae bacterium]